MVKRVGGLKPELHSRGPRFTEREVLEQREVPLLIAGPTDAVARSVARPDLSGWNIRQARCVEPPTKQVRRIGIWIADEIGSRCCSTAGVENAQSCRVC